MIKRKAFVGTAMAIAVSTLAIIGSVSFAWFQANAAVSIQANNSSAEITVAAPDQMLKITKISVIGDTTSGITPVYTANEGKNYEISLTDTRKLTDVSGDATYESDGSTEVTPVSLFKPVFASNYEASVVNAGYATIFDVSDSTDTFSTLATGDAYPFVRFGFKIQNITASSKAVYPIYTMSESSGMHIARASVCMLDTTYTANQTDFTSVTREDWEEIAYLATEAEAVTPICLETDGPGYSFSVDASANSVGVIGSTFSAYLGASKTSVDASSGYAPTASPIVTLGAANSATDSAFFAVTIWVEGQDPDCWSASEISDEIAFRVEMY